MLEKKTRVLSGQSNYRGIIKMGLIIRDMTQEDVAHVQTIARESWKKTYEGIIPAKIQENFLNAAYSDVMMKKRLNHSILFVAERDSKIVGFANYSQMNDEGQIELSAIYLSPHDQGKGIGTALLQKGIDEIDGMKQIYIDVEEKNTIGKTFYEAKGFKVINKYDDNFDGHILKTCRMVLTIEN